MNMQTRFCGLNLVWLKVSRFYTNTAMRRVCLKNTFLTVEEDTACLELAASESPCSRRSRSEEPSRGHEPHEADNVLEVQLETLNKIIESSKSLRNATTVASTATQESSVRVEDLKRLQEKMNDVCRAKEDGRIGQMGNRSLGKMGCVMSNMSLSTMAPSDENDDDSFSRMRQVLSSNSICTLASQTTGDDDVEFDLTMEEVDGQDPSSEALPLRSLPKESRHFNVPKTVNLAVEYAKSDREQLVTTLMIRNIPNRYSQRELINELKSLGFGGTFDFLYIPLDLGTMSNVGYAFVNFVDHLWAEKCMEAFQNYRFRRHRQAGKVAAVSVAHIQGLDGNLRHYEKSAVNTARSVWRSSSLRRHVGVFTEFLRFIR